MRGKHGNVTSATLKGRITPADAGKTFFNNVNRKCYQDHPRGCGENMRYIICVMTVKGSPPRMRGKLFCTIVSAAVGGITPADAGKTLSLKKSFSIL